MTQLTVAVVVCTRDRPDDLMSCLKSLAEQSPKVSEVVIVSGSDSSSPAGLLTRFAPLKIRVTECYEHNISRARNAGMRATDADVVVFIDDDAVAREGWIGAYLGAFDEHPGAWVIGGDVYDSRTEPMELEFSRGLVSPTGKQLPVRRGDSAECPRGFVPNVKGCNFAVRREPVVALGGFDEFFAFAYDEADLVMTARGGGASGGDAVHAAGAVVDHAHTPGHYRQTDWMDRDWKTEYASHSMFVLRHTAGRERWLGRWVVRRRMGKLAVLALGSALRGKLSVVRGFRSVLEAHRGIGEARAEARRRGLR